MMKSEPLISVIVPVYNTAAWLPRCLDSICAQSYTNLEILCIDDGSTDGSAGILEEYAVKDSRIKVFAQKNAGLSAARNTALEHATGDWIAGVDSDDYLDPDIFRKAMSCVEDMVDMVAFGVQCVWDDAGKEPEIFQKFAADMVLPMSVDVAAGLHVCFWNKLWRRSVIEENRLRFPHGLIHEDDAFFYLFVPYARRVAMCEAVGYYYVQRRGSITKSAQSELETTVRYTQVMHYVHRVYVLRGDDPVESPWFRLFVARVYADRYHVVPAAQQEALNAIFYDLLQELKMQTLVKADYRFRRMVPVRGWRRVFLSRYLNAELWRILGVPVWEVEYRNGQPVQQRFMLLRFIRCKLNAMFSLFSGRANA